MKKDLLKGLTEDQIKKVEDCKSPEEILALAKAEGYELNDEQLEAVSGGCKIKNPYDYIVDETLEQTCLYTVETSCACCGSNNFTQKFETYKNNIANSKVNCTCNDCGHTWSVDLL